VEQAVKVRVVVQLTLMTLLTQMTQMTQMTLMTQIAEQGLSKEMALVSTWIKKTLKKK
jgi:hypothetical protein